MTRSRTFWAVFAGLGVAGAFAAVRLFPVAFPIISLDIEMDRAAAIGEAGRLAELREWEPMGARSAASFGAFDPEVQTYVELEGGGRDAFVQLAARNVYQPYGWTVRRFAEGAVEEARVRFTPGGEPYGFTLRLSEDDPGRGNLDDDDALAAARATAQEWGVDLGSFELLEASESTEPSGRVDHTLVFERTDERVAEARFRLRVRIAGDRASDLSHFVHVPEAFSQRYADMRAANDAIALASQSVFILVFVLLGAGVGTALLMRQRWIEWRVALVWGGITAVLFGLNAANALPLSWMAYDTAVPARLFLLEHLAAAALIAVVGTPLLGFFFLAGESLGRRAFPHHIQQWRFWSPEVAASTPALGRTVAAYLLLGLELGYVVTFYLTTSRLEGWWSPADALVQPDLLATFQPWLQAVSISLFAAFWEESVFRAVPIACAALIGARYGRRNLWIWGAVVVQAVIFAAGHANYPQQPAYARVIELSVPAFAWGVIYLYWGLVPTVLTHFVYDLSLISIPLFAADAPGLLFDRAVVVVVGLVPLLIVLRARWRVGARAAVPPWALNTAWRPVAADEPVAEPPAVSDPPPEAAGPRSPPIKPGVAYSLGLVGAAIWLAVLLRPGPEPPRLAESRGDAISAARAVLDAQGYDVTDWTPLVTIPSGRGTDHRYVFEEAGAETYLALLGGYLGQPRWIVRFVDFEAEPELRVEEHTVHVGHRGEVLRVRHVLPEASEGSRLEEAEARDLTRAAASERFPDASAALAEIGAEQTARPERRDWEFTFNDPGALPDVGGEARVSVVLAGDEVSDVRGFVHVPEEWERARRRASTRRTLVVAGVGLLLLLGFGAADVFAIVLWARRRLPVGVALAVFGTAGVAMAISQANGWPGTTALFSAEQPWGLQVGFALFGLLLVTCVGSAAIGLAAALGHAWLGPERREPAPAAVAVAIGLALAGAQAGVGALGGGLPSWPDYASATAFLPALSGALAPVVPYLFATTALLLLSALAVRGEGSPVLSTVLYTAITCLGLTLVPEGLQRSIVTWVPAGLAATVVVYLLVRLGAARPAWIPGVLATLLVADLAGLVVLRPYPGAVVGALLGAGVVTWLARAWMRALSAADRLERAG